MNKEIYIRVSKDGWTGGMQLSIGVDEDGSGHGYRIHGPKFNGSSKDVLRHVISERDATKIRDYLDMVVPATPQPNKGD